MKHQEQIGLVEDFNKNCPPQLKEQSGLHATVRHWLSLQEARIQREYMKCPDYEEAQGIIVDAIHEVDASRKNETEPLDSYDCADNILKALNITPEGKGE